MNVGVKRKVAVTQKYCMDPQTGNYSENYDLQHRTHNIDNYGHLSISQTQLHPPPVQVTTTFTN